MKRWYVCLLCVLGFVLIGCQSDQQLEQPENIFFDGILVWDDVENATSYELSINDETYTVNLPYFDQLIEEGHYVIEIIAKGDETWLDSKPTTYVLDIDYAQDAVISFERQGTNLIWTDIDQATSFLVGYDGQFEKVLSANYDISTIKDGSLTVQAIFPDGSKTAVFSYSLD